MRDIRQTSQYAKYLSTQGWKVEKFDNTYAYIKIIPIIGAIIKIQRPENITKSTISKLIKKYKPFQLIVEPKTDKQVKFLTRQGFRQGRGTYLPSKTLHINLTKSKKDLLKNLKKDARYALRKTEKLIVSHDIPVEYFRKAWKQAVNFSRFVHTESQLLAIKNEYKYNSLLLTSHNKEKRTNKQSINSGAIFLSTGKVAYYWQSFTTKSGRSTLAQYRLLWEGILWAKNSGCKTFDFEGIYDKRYPNKSWLGFSHFKKSFGGKEVTYPKTYIKHFWTNPLVNVANQFILTISTKKVT